MSGESDWCPGEEDEDMYRNESSGSGSGNNSSNAGSGSDSDSDIKTPKRKRRRSKRLSKTNSNNEEDSSEELLLITKSKKKTTNKSKKKTATTKKRKTNKGRRKSKSGSVHSNHSIHDTEEKDENENTNNHNNILELDSSSDDTGSAVDIHSNSTNYNKTDQKNKRGQKRKLSAITTLKVGDDNDNGDNHNNNSAGDSDATVVLDENKPPPKKKSKLMTTTTKSKSSKKITKTTTTTTKPRSKTKTATKMEPKTQTALEMVMALSKARKTKNGGKKTLIKGKMATDAISEFMIKENRPWNVPGLKLCLNGAIGDAQIKKSLKQLVNKGILTDSMFGKQQLFWRTQESTHNDNDNDDEKDEDEDNHNQNNNGNTNAAAVMIADLEETKNRNSEILMQLKKEHQRLKKLQSDAVIAQRLQALQDERESNEHALAIQRGPSSSSSNTSVTITLAMIDQKLIVFYKYYKPWMQRKKMCMNMIGQIFEDCPSKPSKILTSRLNGETDEESITEDFKQKMSEYSEFFKRAELAFRRHEDQKNQTRKEQMQQQKKLKRKSRKFK